MSSLPFLSIDVFRCPFADCLDEDVFFDDNDDDVFEDLEEAFNNLFSSFRASLLDTLRSLSASRSQASKDWVVVVVGEEGQDWSGR